MAKKRVKATKAKRTKKLVTAKAKPRRHSGQRASGVGRSAARKIRVQSTKSPAKKTKNASAKRSVAKKVKAGARRPATPQDTKREVRRRDGSGHLDPRYAADLRRQSGRPEPEGVGFVAQARSSDDLAEVLGEQFVEGATTGEGAAEEELDQEVPEERGGPFVRSTGGTEFAAGTDRSNPKGAKREPFPTT